MRRRGPRRGAQGATARFIFVTVLGLVGGDTATPDKVRGRLDAVDRKGLPEGRSGSTVRCSQRTRSSFCRGRGKPRSSHPPLSRPRARGPVIAGGAAH